MRVPSHTFCAPIGYQMMRGSPTWTPILIGTQTQVIHSLTFTACAERCSHSVGISHWYGFVANFRSVVVCRNVEMPHNVLALDFHIHRPRLKVNLPGDLAVDKPLLRRTPSLVPHAFLEIALVLEHDLLAGDLHRARSIRCVGRHARIWIGNGNTGRCGRRLRRGHADIGKRTDGFAGCRLARDLHVVGVDLVRHHAPPKFSTTAARWPVSLARCARMPGPGA